MIYVLGIETSCDETSAAIVKDGKKILSCQVSSSLKFHKKYGGVIPEIASRMQLEAIALVTDAALKEAGLKLKDIGLVGVTNGPGLLGSLLVGISFAKAISFSLGVPLIGINHIYSHVYACFLNTLNIALPCIALVVSGGHTSLFYIKNFDEIEVLGTTQDDACGEAFDKVAKILGLGYPGGPLIEKLSKGSNFKRIRFQCSETKNPLDFSFSGIKTGVLYYVHRLKNSPLNQLEIKDKDKLSRKLTQSVASSFQETVINTLIKKSLSACKTKRINRLLIGGGVAANLRLRERFLEEAGNKKINIYFPSQRFSLDNAAMVAGLAYRLYKLGYRSGLDLDSELN